MISNQTSVVGDNYSTTPRTESTYAKKIFIISDHVFMVVNYIIFFLGPFCCFFRDFLSMYL
jgi:hypothetical protein